MIAGNALPQRLLVLGAGSAIAQATVEALAGHGLQSVVLAARRPDQLKHWVEQLQANHPKLHCTTVGFDAAATATHAALVEQIWHGGGRIDAALVAFGVLGPVGRQPSGSTSSDTIEVNFVGAASLVLLLRDRFVEQGQGHLVVISSVAACRPRANNAVYAATKAGIDTLARGLGDGLASDAVTVTVVRPGYVASPMTEGLAPAPFATTPERVAADIVRGMRRRAAVVWSPPILRPVVAAMTRLPDPLYRRLTSRR